MLTLRKFCRGGREDREDPRKSWVSSSDVSKTNTDVREVTGPLIFSASARIAGSLRAPEVALP